MSPTPDPRQAELGRKLARVRDELARAGLDGIRLRGVDWFAWATCGGSSVVILTSEAGVAEVLITREGAWVLTDEIERDRLQQEELPRGLEVLAHPWAEPARREALVAERVRGGPVASDRPAAGEKPLPEGLVRARWSLGEEELARYRRLSRESAEAVTDVLLAAAPTWTGFELAGAASEALWSRGIHPTLALVGDERRLPLHRHATASAERLGSRAMLVVCARRHGLYANFTRFVYFRPPTREERGLAEAVARVEAEAFAASTPGATLAQVYQRLCSAYAAAGHPGAERKHHQGGSCGYLSRDVVARPDTHAVLEPNNALAWNPSLPGAKVEDTVVTSASGIEVLTVDPRWPTAEVAGRRRPELLVR